MGKPKPPSPPDPAETAAAQTSTNVNTALANAQLGNVDLVTPYGTRTYTTDPTKTRTIVDTKGEGPPVEYEVPQYVQTDTLSPTQQAISDQQEAAALGLSSLANEQTGFLRDYLSTPFTGTNEEVESRIVDLGRRRLDPILAQQDEDLRTRLANQGIQVGSEAYDREMDLQNQARNDAYNQLLLQGRGQAFNEALATRAQPINEIGALLGTGQVTYPSFQSPNQPTIPTVDYAGLVNENYNQRLGIYNSKVAARQNLLGGLFGLGAAVISDERVKKDKKKIGKVGGHNVYSFRYKGQKGGPKDVGVMAQEVERKRPDAVVKGADGYRRVKYGQLFGA